MSDRTTLIATMRNRKFRKIFRNPKTVNPELIDSFNYQKNINFYLQFRLKIKLQSLCKANLSLLCLPKIKSYSYNIFLEKII
ncbi:hypothetical protein Ava_4477 [Trichormus variabilis ATCC 29413]|uniref:Uncharacterized protein n=1 Tax=Trichormus variabilis (strain ATCC 29413 / PCC 7937) TaxID=240292 RepID=Q3M4L1_TRIV2|nr:hypothetical protein Ava_4477 [Trichormus variabilis ATCC 29413]